MESVACENRHRILVVGADPETVETLADMAGPAWRVVGVPDGKGALRMMEHRACDLVLLDTALPGMGGLETLRRMRAMAPQVEVIVISAADRTQEAVAAMRLGARDYIGKPFEAEVIRSVISRALEAPRLRRDTRFLNTQAAAHWETAGLIGLSAPMRSVARLVARVSQTSSTVLISGESGTGKELVARAVHTHSRRRRMPFVPVNCAAIPRELMESEVFGHEKGAFTGAHRRSAGKFTHAAGGTVFLDEISSMDLSLQAKLLRFLQDRRVTPVGAVRATRLDVRIIAATNTSLEELVRCGRFRQDLYFRLNVLPIHLPPLRRRPGDVGLLASHFLECSARRLNRRITGFSPRVLEILAAYDWPGNVRELENLVERMAVLAVDGQRIEECDLPQELLAGSPLSRRWEPPVDGGLLPARRAFERRLILGALKSCSWNQSAAARRLGIHRNTLAQKMRRLDIAPAPSRK